MGKVVKALRALRWLMPVVFGIGFVACKKEVAEPTDADAAGEFTGERVYRNSFFGFEITFPSDWHVEEGSNAERAEKASEVSKKSTSELAGEIVFTASLHSPESEKEPEVVALLQIQTMQVEGGELNGEAALLSLKKELSGNLKVRFLGKPELVQHGGSAFWMQEWSYSKEAETKIQRLLCKVKGRKLVTLGVSYAADSEKGKLKALKFLEGIKAIKP